MRGTIIKGMGGIYTVSGEDGQQYILRARGILRRQRMTPLVGDFVRIQPGEGEEHGWLEEILPRKSVSIRPPVANMDLMVLVIAPVPEPDLLLIDRLLIRARQEGQDAVLCVNKRELAPELGPRITQEYARAEIQVVEASALEQQGLDQLRGAMEGRLCCLAGQSGVGKSTLLNQLLGMELKTGGMSRKTERGRHTTRHAELLEGNGLRVFDTPGFSLFSTANMEPELLQDHYPEMESLRCDCRFQPCLHDREPDCAVSQAAEAGELSQERLARYRILLEEVRQAWRSRYD